MTAKNDCRRTFQFRAVSSRKGRCLLAAPIGRTPLPAEGCPKSVASKFRRETCRPFEIETNAKLALSRRKSVTTTGVISRNPARRRRRLHAERIVCRPFAPVAAHRNRRRVIALGPMPDGTFSVRGFTSVLYVFIVRINEYVTSQSGGEKTRAPDSLRPLLAVRSYTAGLHFVAGSQCDGLSFSVRFRRRNRFDSKI